MSNDPKAEPGETPWAGESVFITSAVSTSGLPDGDKVEIAFAGRSNVGKSTLLNTLVGRKGLAKASNTPGRTRMLNYFHLTGNKGALDCYLVDMPGFGYARASKSEIKSWTGLVKAYLRGRVTLRRVFFLIDTRRGVMPGDKEILELLQEAAVSTQVIMTKADKLKISDRQKAYEAVKKDLKPFVIVHPDILLTSSLKKLGIDELRAAVLDLCQNI
ncbi:MAG: ribosome biogenesis GTP-binding protein YihA/YsxC [Sphingomonadales bacterium]